MAKTGGLGALNVSLGLDAADFTSGLAKAQKDAAAATQAIKNQFATIVGAIGVGLSAKAFVDLVKGSIDAADHLNDLSKQTGIAVETLGGIGFAAGQAGGDLESAAAAAGKLNKVLAEAASGNKEAVALFKALGIEVKDASGRTKDAGAVMVELAGKFETFADGPEKAALALKLFGKAGAAQIALLNDGAQALQENIDYYKRFSGVTADVAKQADDFNDTLGKINLINQSLGTQLASELLPALKGVADAFLEAKEKSDLFSGIASGVRVVFETIIVLGTEVKFVLVQIGEAIGALDAAKAAFMRGDVGQIKTIFDAYNEQAKDARAEVDRFTASIVKTQDRVDPSGFFKTASSFGGQRKPAAPGVPDSSAGDDAAAALKKQIEGQIKIIQDGARAQADAFRFGQSYLDGAYADALLSQRDFFDQQKNLRDVALASQIEAIDKEIVLQRRLASNPGSKPADREQAEQRIKLAVQQRAEAVTRAGAAEILANQANAQAAENLGDAYAALHARVLEASGNEAGAAAIRNATQIREAARLVAQAGGDESDVAALSRILDLQQQSAQQQRDYAKLLDDVGRREAEIYLDAQAAGKGELETLAAIRDARTIAIEQLRQQAAAAADLAKISGTDADAKRAADLALAVKKAAAEIDPLAAKFNTLFEDAGANAFASFLDGTKSAKDAFKDFANSVISEIARIAARNLAKSVFGDAGGSSGLGGFLSSLFGSSSGSNPNYSNEGRNYPALAVGTNYIPQDGLYKLHKGEAVQPTKYNPAAGGKSGGDVFITNVGGSRVTTQRDGPNLRVLVESAAELAHANVTADLASGTGPASVASRARNGTGPGAIARRG